MVSLQEEQRTGWDPDDKERSKLKKKVKKSLERIIQRYKLNDAFEDTDDVEMLAEVELEGFSYTIIKKSKTKYEPLTRREKEIASLAGHGFANKVIARSLGISQYTVASHMRRIFQKLQINSRAAIGRQTFFLW